MIIQFTLTMPQVGSWDGKWSGADRLYARCRYYKKADCDKIMDGKDTRSWFYRWSDGWGAQVTAQIVAAEEAAKIRKKSTGFCNYEWMIDSIEKHGKIIIERDVLCSEAING